MFKLRKKWARYAVIFEFDNGNYWTLTEYMSGPEASDTLHRLENSDAGHSILLSRLSEHMRSGHMTPEYVVRGLLKAGITEEQIDTAREYADEVIQGISC